MSENIESTGVGKVEDESVLSLQGLEGDDEAPEVEAHESHLSVAVCGVAPQ
ncbi:hypothetical protein ABZ307_37295 [Streptomyces griseorubiginosus]|uniref:hypothetical protein n=1 Tax=Streptomyces griseorubiginosus TaxID=67304 RepID=UPI0033AC882F